MSEIDNNSHGQKPRTSKLAIASVMCVGVSIACGMLLTRLGPADRLSGVLILAGFVCLVAAPFFGYAALEKIKESDGLLTGKGLAIVGMSIVGFCIILGFIMPQLGKPSPMARRLVCGTNLKGLGSAMLIYAREFDDKYPTPDKWCDLLLQGDYERPKQFVCKAAASEGDKGPCHYAINPNCEPNSPNDVVLLFETKGGWNQSGGPEILTTENHAGEGCNVLFNDGSAKFVRTGEVGKLRWKVEETEK